MRVGPFKKPASFLNIFLISRPLARLGVRVAMELSHKTLLALASSAITWLLLVGVSLQSLAKQMMFWPERTGLSGVACAGLTAAHGAGEVSIVDCITPASRH